MGYIQLLYHKVQSSHPLLPEGKCVSVCPDGFYGNEDLNECEECHLDCATCSGPENKDCLSCEEGRTLANEECVPEREVCPIRTFLNGETNNLYSANPTVCS